MHILKHIGDEVKNSNTSQLQKQTVGEIELLISLIEDPVFHDIIVIFDSLNDLNSQILQHPSILPGDFIINSAGQLEVSIPNSAKTTVNDVIYRKRYHDSIELDDQRVPVVQPGDIFNEEITIKACTRRWNYLQLPQDERWKLVLSSSWALPLVPTHRFVEVIDVIEQLSQTLINDFPNVAMYIAYLRNFWLPLALQVSVSGNSVKTNNIAEAFNRHLPKKLGGERPPIPRFLVRSTQIFVDCQTLWQQLDNPVPIDTRRLYQIECDRTIRARQDLLDLGRYTMRDFLTSIFD